MDQYCVVVCGLQAGASGEASAWQPVAAALKLDHAEFERRVVTALPRILRGHLDQATAERIAQVLQAMHVDASALPDDPQLAYIDRAGTTCGPLPHSSLGDFIQPGESYRLHGDTEWKSWPEAAATLTFEFDDFEDFDDVPPAAGDEPLDATQTPDTWGEIDDTAPDALTAGTDDESLQATPTPLLADDGDAIGDTAPDALPPVADDEPHYATPPPLPAPPAGQEEPVSETDGDPEATSPTMDAEESIRDDELIDPAAELSALSDADASARAAAEIAAPKRSRTGRLIVLLVLVLLAIWAYRHWTADTRVDGSPSVPAVIQSSNATSGNPVTPAQVVPGQDPVPTPATSASAAEATSVSAPAATSAALAAATAAAPAIAISAALPAGATTAPPTAASAPATATTTEAAASAPAESSGTLPVIAGRFIPAPSAPASATSITPAAPSRH